MRRFTQVDVFSDQPFGGNPVAVVHDAEGLADEEMAAFARWTNLSETTFLLPPTRDGADYRLRIFTPAEELSFAGHPTLGSAHAWLEAGGSSGASGGVGVVQECADGLVEIRVGAGRLAFAAPPLTRSGPADEATRDRVARSLRVDPSALVDVAWVDNGPGWVAARLGSAAEVLALQPDWFAMVGLEVGVVGPYGAGEHPAGAAVEVRAFCPSLGVVEDPVTGSLNAGLAQWLTADGTLPASYVASQGTVLGRAGLVHVDRVDGVVWVGGATVSRVRGEVSFGVGAAV